MKKSHPAIDTALLPQYRESAAFMERFLIAAHVDGAIIERSPNAKGIKLIDDTELDFDVLSYFTKSCEKFRSEFIEELENLISEESIKIFCDVVAKEWFDGSRLRKNGNCQRLKRSVLDYLRDSSENSPSLGRWVQNEEDLSEIEPLLTADEIDIITTVNRQMLYRHIEEWKASHPNNDSISDSDIFIRRGIALQKEIETSKLYTEWDFINSYSIAFSAPEKFSQMVTAENPKAIPALLNGELTIFLNRVLFFSPFIPNMSVGQLEFGIIPSTEPLPIHCQGRHGGILEYIIDPAPFQV